MVPKCIYTLREKTEIKTIFNQGYTLFMGETYISASEVVCDCIYDHDPVFISYIGELIQIS